MLFLFRAIIDRVKTLFAISAAQELEAECLSRDAERRADLLRQADRYDDEGLHGIAQQLRRRAEELDHRQPLAGVLPGIQHLTDQDHATATPLLPAPASSAAPEVAPNRLAVPAPKKKGR